MNILRRPPSSLGDPGAFRLLLSLLVMFQHNGGILAGTPAVYVFFALSGYWIFELWQATAKSGILANYVRFLVSRTLRIYPAYFFGLGVLLVFYFAVRPTIAHPVGTGEWLSNVFIFGLSHAPARAILLLPAWSLDVELQFYLLAPVLFIVLGLANRTAGFIALLMASVLSVALFVAQPVHATGTLITSFGFFVAGVLAAQRNIRWSATAATVSACLAIAGLVALVWIRTWPLARLATNLYAVKMLLLTMAIVALPFALWTVRRASDGVDRFLGRLSYEVYLFHYIPIAVVAAAFPALHGLHRLAVLVPLTVLMLCVCVLVVVVIDMPVDRFRKRIEAAKPVQPTLHTVPGA